MYIRTCTQARTRLIIPRCVMRKCKIIIEPWMFPACLIQRLIGHSALGPIRFCRLRRRRRYFGDLLEFEMLKKNTLILKLRKLLICNISTVRPLIPDDRKTTQLTLNINQNFISGCFTSLFKSYDIPNFNT